MVVLKVQEFKIETIKTSVGWIYIYISIGSGYPPIYYLSDPVIIIKKSIIISFKDIIKIIKI
jgi:hypothetical protein